MAIYYKTHPKHKCTMWRKMHDFLLLQQVVSYRYHWVLKVYSI